MTKALEEVLKDVSKLPEAEQDALAEAIRAEIGTEKDWDQSFGSGSGPMGSMTGFFRRCATVNNPSALYPAG